MSVWLYIYCPENTMFPPKRAHIHKCNTLSHNLSSADTVYI